MHFLKFFFVALISQLRSIFFVILNIFSKRETKLYPEEKVDLSSRYRGRIILTSDKKGNERCVACNLCASVCPSSCIVLKQAKTKDNRYFPKFFKIDFSRCIFCGLCEEACPTAAIQLIPDFELSDYKKEDLIYEKEDLLISGTGKYPDYDFYSVSGIKANSNNFNKNKKIIDCVDTKKILP
ncbi:NADH-quinone oxidoreductase subunit NuoI [Buchnera aphidicola (Ceratoglyphina bambusae)]|uniref:NADH-quinone oxidoreductase subunit NuoI n=1 Tax=Buchnera aphidicola TaxID=9 RepID=UPI0031B83322